MGELKLRHPRFKEMKQWRDSLATCLDLSICGNFVLIGYDSGHVDKFNIQSGIFRGSLESSQGQPAHPGAVIKGIITDGLNQLIITGDNEKLIRFWKFPTHHCLLNEDLVMSSGIQQMVIHRESALMAITLENLNIEIMDIITRKIVRKFNKVHQACVNDLAFSKDCRWMITVSQDKTLKVWDVPSGNLIDHVGFTSQATSVTMSPTSDFVATTHQDDVGIYLWCNKSLYGHVSLKPLCPEESKPTFIRMPTA